MLEMKREYATSRTNHLFAGHRAAIGLEPATPEAGDLIGQVPDIDVITAGKHQISLQRVVAILHIGRRGILILLVAHGFRSARSLRLEAVALGIDLVEEGFEVFLYRHQHDIAHPGEILSAQVIGHTLALIDAEPDGDGMLRIELLKLRQTVWMISNASRRDCRSIRPS